MPRRISPRPRTGRGLLVADVEPGDDELVERQRRRQQGGAAIDGRISGQVTSRKVRSGVAPRSRAASEDGEIEGLEAGFIVRMTKAADQDLADCRVGQPLGRAQVRKNTAREDPDDQQRHTPPAAGWRSAARPRTAGRFSFSGRRRRRRRWCPAAMPRPAARMRLFISATREPARCPGAWHTIRAEAPIGQAWRRAAEVANGEQHGDDHRQHRDRAGRPRRKPLASRLRRRPTRRRPADRRISARWMTSTTATVTKASAAPSGQLEPCRGTGRR